MFSVTIIFLQVLIGPWPIGPSQAEVATTRPSKPTVKSAEPPYVSPATLFSFFFTYLILGKGKRTSWWGKMSVMSKTDDGLSFGVRRGFSHHFPMVFVPHVP